MLYPLLTLCIIAQLCASALFIMHKANFSISCTKEKILHFWLLVRMTAFDCAGGHLFTLFMFLKLFFMFSESICRFLIPMYDISRNNSDTVQIRVQQLYMFMPV